MSSATAACTVARAPTSTPRVGSSSRSTRGARRSQRARITFCWLPPDSVSIAWSGDDAWIANRAADRRASPASRPRRSRSRSQWSVRRRGGQVLAQRRLPERGRRCGRGGTYATPWRMASPMSRNVTGRPSRRMSPRLTGRMPKSIWRRLRAPGAECAGDAHDLAVAHRAAHAPRPGPGEPSRPSATGPGGTGGADCCVSSTGCPTISSISSSRWSSARTGRGHDSVAQHGRGVGDGRDLVDGGSRRARARPPAVRGARRTRAALSAPAPPSARRAHRRDHLGPRPGGLARCHHRGGRSARAVQEGGMVRRRSRIVP